MKDQVRNILEEDFIQRPFVWCSEVSDRYSELYDVSFTNSFMIDIIKQIPNWEIDKCECSNPMIYRKQ